MSQGGKRDAAWVADRIVAQLKTSLPARLDTLDTEYNDGITLADIPVDHYVISERQKLPGFPMVAVIQDDTDISENEFRYNAERHSMTVAVAMMDNINEDDLVRRTHRTLRGIEEVFLDNRTLSGSVVDLKCIHKSYSSLMTNGNALLKEGQLEIEVMTTVA